LLVILQRSLNSEQVNDSVPTAQVILVFDERVFMNSKKKINMRAF